jgi:carbamate kinase
MTKWAVIAVGGNALIKDPQHKTVQDQYKAAKETMHHIAGMIEQGWEIAIGHGNGPQVGFILRRSEIAEKVAGMHPVPLDACGADSQGAIGYAFQQNLYNEFKRRGMKKSVATVVTQVLVDRNDPAFENPTKPIGSFMDETEARQRAENEGPNSIEHGKPGVYALGKVFKRSNHPHLTTFKSGLSRSDTSGQAFSIRSLLGDTPLPMPPSSPVATEAHGTAGIPS